MSHAIKEITVLQYSSICKLRILIETGTFHGEMVRIAENHFDKIYSIELDPGLANTARYNFSNHKHIQILQGDSGMVMPGLLRNLQQPALFWLDGHYSGMGTAKGTRETPILEELKAIAADPIQKRGVILIDDARLYDGTGDWPSLDELAGLMAEREFEVRDDIIRIT